MQQSVNIPGPTLEEKIRFLSDPATYPHPHKEVQVIETHMSWVFLVGERVYKLKKPVSYPFLDFSTPGRRKLMVGEEIRLNRRLAPGVYLGARALRVGPDGGLTLAADGKIADWLVEMRRLPEGRTLRAALVAGRATRSDIAHVADILIPFYRGLDPAETSSGAYTGRFAKEIESTARVLSDPGFNFDGARVAKALRNLDDRFEAVRPLLGKRASDGRVVEGHGDLRPEHIFLNDPPVIIDCLEFNRGLRTVDPFEEIVLLGLESAQLGADWVFAELIRRVSLGLDERPKPALLAFHWQYRAFLRARLSLVHLSEPVIRKPEKWRPLAWRYIKLAEEADIRTGLK